MSDLAAREAELRRRLRDDLEFYAARALTLRTKGGGAATLRFNNTQRFVDRRLDAQRAATGRVRAWILKGRQQGVSTYVGGRYYHTTTHRRGLRTFVMAHRDDATSNLFEMVTRFHAHCPELIRPRTGASNAKTLAFPGLDSAYVVATAGGVDVARSGTFQLVHGSEVAFWPNAEMHMAGLMEAVPDQAGTEVILESTANGLGDVFHSGWSAAVAGESDFQAIFAPWFLHEEYAREPPPGWRPTGEWVEYQRAHDLSAAQVYWAQRKSANMAALAGQRADAGKPFWKFRQEYPATAVEAFQAAAEGAFIRPELVAAARKREIEGRGALVLGVDPARDRDATAVVDRQGRRLGAHICERWRDGDLMTTAGRLAKLIDRLRPRKVFLDVGGMGAGLYDRLRELKYQMVEPVNFGSSALGIGPTGDEKYANRRAEMWDCLRAWLEEPAGVQIPDLDELQADLCSVMWGKGATRHDSNQALVLESKDHIRDRKLPSPDLADAAALTFARPMARRDEEEERQDRYRAKKRKSRGSAWAA